MKHTALSFFAALPLGVALFACGGNDSTAPSTTSGGSPGSSGSSPTEETNAAGGPTSTSSKTPASPVAVKNLTVSVDDEKMRCTANGYSAETIACPMLTFRFVVENGGESPVQVVERIRMRFGDDELFNDDDGLCANAPWTLAPGESSKLITLYFQFGLRNAERPAYVYPCGANDNSMRPVTGARPYGEKLPSVPTSGEMTLVVEGRLEDGTPFTASALGVLTL